MRITDFLTNLHPFILKIRQWYIVHDRSFVMFAPSTEWITQFFCSIQSY